MVEIPDCLFQNCIGRNQPDRNAWPAFWHGFKNRFQGSAGKKCFSSPSRDFEANMGSTRDGIPIWLYSPNTDTHVFRFPMILIGFHHIVIGIQKMKIGNQVFQRVFLIILQFHRPTPYSLEISRGIFLNVIWAPCSSSSLRVHRSA